MSTRSAVAEPAGDGWRGRYHHWDGYPTNKAADLWKIVQRDGVQMARQVLIHEHRGWSSTDADQQPGEGYLGNARANVVVGYGEAYSDEEQPDQWETSEEPDSLWIEWVYVLADKGMTVLASAYPQDGYKHVGFFEWDGQEPDWEAVEARRYAA
jgi:hypothetical protein